MKIHLISDLHTEFSPYLNQPAPTGTDVIIAAGDITVGSFGPAILRANFGNDLPIIYVAGNHEFYRQNMPELRAEIAKEAKRTGVIFLDNSYAYIDDVMFVGGTFWTDFCVYGDQNQFPAMNAAAAGINDFRLISVEGKYENNGRNPNYQKYKAFTPTQALNEHHETKAYIVDMLENRAPGSKTVVVTHMGPHPKSIHEKYAGDLLNCYYVSDQSKMIEKYQPALWVHGHVHDSFDYQLGDTRVVTNPRGYVRGAGKYAERENAVFNPTLLLEV